MENQEEFINENHLTEEAPLQEEASQQEAPLEEFVAGDDVLPEIPKEYNNFENEILADNSNAQTAEEIAANNEFKELKKLIDFRSEAAIICETKENNPNYLAIIHANEPFYQDFGVKEFNLIGKSYDFFFEDLDLDYSSEDQIEYVRLIKAVKDFHECAIIISISDHKGDAANKVRFKISFLPSEESEITKRHAIFTFEKMETEESLSAEFAVDGEGDHASNKASAMILKNLERTLRKERILREVAGLIISDLPIRDIAQSMAKILCQHLRADRCLVHDYKDGHTSFVAEHYENAKPMFKSGDEIVNIKSLTRYINFQNHFYEKFGDKNKKSSLCIIDDVLNDVNFSSVSDICQEYSIVSQIAVTTSFNEKVNGGIYIQQSDKRAWLHEEIELIDTIADQFSIALDRSDSIERVMVANHELLEKTQQLKDSLQQEKEMRKMQNEFVALVSHEFKTPLQIIDGTRELLVRKIKKFSEDASFSKSLDRIKGAIQRMNGLIESTLNLAQMENGTNSIKVQYETMNLKEFIFDIIEKNSNLAVTKQIEVLTNLDQLPEEFVGDKKLLDHSITNIISNAIKYSKNSSKVKVLAKANNEKVAIKVIDQGIGIPKDDIKNIGQKFFRAKNTLAVAGTGIGVYLTKHFVELQGGTVLIQSEVDVGTSVTITLLKNPKNS